jgi:glycosyltransferase involved in cell wall biosynthesis
MRIGIDARCLIEGRRTGVEEYTLSLLSNLFEIDQENKYILFINSWKNPAGDFSWVKKYPNVRIKRFNYPNKILNFLFWYFSWPKIDRMIGGADFFFFPNLNFGTVSKKCKVINTIHDLSFERYPEYFSIKRRLWHSFVNPKKACQRADRIVTVSHSSRNDVISKYRISPKKIKVIHSAVGEKFSMTDRNDRNLIRVKEKYGLPYKFMLYLGTIEPRKNIAAIVRAYSQLQRFAHETKNEELKKYKLVIAGEKGWLSGKIFWEMRQARFCENIYLISFVDDIDKEFVYNLASLFVYPSFFEGFGFPPLEAMKCGVPVITSNNSSLPEVVGKAGILIDPDKPDEIYRAMKEVLISRELHSQLMTLGLRRAKEFSWKRTAESFLEMLREVV